MIRLALIAALLTAGGLGPDALQVIDNAVRHEGPPPPHAPAVVRELFARPLDAQDAAALFRRAIPPELIDAVETPAQPAPQPFAEALSRYIEELAVAQRLLRDATAKAPVDDAAIVRRLDEGLLSADQLLGVAAAVERVQLLRANAMFVEATVRFARAARAATDFPAQAARFDSAIGIVSIGSLGNDRHGPDAALIVDPGGDDVYERAPATGGAVSVIVDLGGNDRYTGSDVAVRALSAIVDFSGDDRYEMTSGLGAAIAGVSLLVDVEGNDSYKTRYFGQGAAAFGLGALVDLAGDDDYTIGAWGQGFGAAGGVGLLWDRDGDDRYAAAGESDPFERGGRLSGAQGAGFGYRSMLGGGIGILRDERGNDVYQAEMFAQGIGYYYGVGLLWDGGGDDRYLALRYAQGSAAHEAVGVLRDESGNDRYELSFGVGQGMGLDLALGVLFDGGGDDDYRAALLAQGTATANGIGLLADSGGVNRWEIGEPGGDNPRAWGHAEWFAGLPSIGLLLYEERDARFVRAGRALPRPPAPRRVSERRATPQDCERLPLEKLREGIAALRRDHFDAVLALGEALRCSIAAAEPGEAAAIWAELEALLKKDPATPLARSMAGAPENLRRMLEAHPSCDVRALALRTRPTEQAARAALHSSCWRLQAAALVELARMRLDADAGAGLASFLREPPPY